MAAPNEYGLIKRAPKKDVIHPRLPLFEDDDSGEEGSAAVRSNLQKEAARIQARKQTKLDISAALADDPDVFKYDEVYDTMVQKKAQDVSLRKKVDNKKPKYIDSLLKAAKSRKLEQERVVERKVQKERIEEGEKFADKEAFVTSAFKKKMQEMQEQDEKERREAQLEALTDVTKQKDLSGFYRQLYRQTLGTDEAGSVEKSEQEKSGASDVLPTKELAGEDKGSDHSDSLEQKRLPQQKTGRRRDRESRNIRRRRDSSSSSNSSDYHDKPNDEHRVTKRGGHRTVSNESISSSVGEDSDSSGSDIDRNRVSGRMTGRRHSRDSTERRSKSNNGDGKRKKSFSSRSSSSDEETSNSRRKSHRNDSGHSDNGGSATRLKRPKNGEPSATVAAKDVVEPPEMSVRDRLVALFKKRNVGEAFEQARQRYLERKEARMAATMCAT